MTINRFFIASIIKLSRDLLPGKGTDLNRGRSYEIEIMPSSMSATQQKINASLRIDASTSVTIVSAQPRFGKTDRSWLSAAKIEHTRSNLG